MGGDEVRVHLPRPLHPLMAFQDVRAATNMSQARDATKPGPDGSPPLVVIIDLPEPDDAWTPGALAESLRPVISPQAPAPYQQFLIEVRRHLSENRPVLVRGWKRPHPCQFTREGIRDLRGSLGQAVQWQGERRRYLRL